ncbi:MAG: ATP-binding protein [Psychroserpens sp.]|uniref:AAA family ATPase n=1 Tax=Psychroserpens sp. TaxID=2020870 RepID=UPI003CB456C9
MEIKIKRHTIDAISKARKLYDSDAKHARKLGINPAQYSRIKSGEIEGVISDAKWITLARLMKVEQQSQMRWETVQTETYTYIYEQLKVCQKRSISAMVCDLAGIGKSHTARAYVQHHRNAVWIDCSQVKSKQKFVRKIAQEFGIDHTGRYADVYEDLVYYLNGIENPLIIVDEAGDLRYEAFLELKALWNATEYTCAWFMMGADGLEHKITRQRDLKKVGYTEILDRFGNDYKRVSPEGKEALNEFHLRQVAQIAKANGSKLTALQMYAKTKGSLRKVRDQIKKQLNG